MLDTLIEARKPGSPEARKPGSPEARKPGSPEARKPGSPEARKPGSPEARKPGSPEILPRLAWALNNHSRFLIGFKPFSTHNYNALAAFCFAVLYAPVLHGSGMAAASTFPAHQTGELIRCPDWRRLAPPISAADKGQNSASFLQRIAASAKLNPFGSGSSRSGKIDVSPLPDVQTLSAPRSCPVHVIGKGETLGVLATQYLGSSAKWRDIVAANAGLNPKSLTIGQKVQIPCKPASTSVITTQSGQKNQTTHLRSSSARQFRPNSGGAGTGRGSAVPRPVDTAKHSTHTAPTPEPTPEPLLLWVAHEGEYLSDVLKRWGKTAQYRVIVESRDAWKLGVTIRLRATFEEAVSELLRGLAHGGRAPAVSIYPNKVLRLAGGI